jgi:hypothetical protein
VTLRTPAETCLDYSPYSAVGEVVAIARRYANVYLDVFTVSEQRVVDMQHVDVLCLWVCKKLLLSNVSRR